MLVPTAMRAALLAATLSTPSITRCIPPRCQISDMDWRKQQSGDRTAGVAERCVPCEAAAKRGVEIKQAIGIRDAASSGDRRELAIERLRATLQQTASKTTEQAAPALLDALGAAYMAGVKADDPWMRAVASRIAEGERT